MKKAANHYVCDLEGGKLVNLHRSSVDVLFYSAAAFATGNVMAILLTGLGTDGAKGLLELKRLHCPGRKILCRLRNAKGSCPAECGELNRDSGKDNRLDE